MRRIKKALITAARLIYKLIVFRILLPLEYRIYARKPVEERKTVFIEVRRDRISSSFALLWNALGNDGRHELELCKLMLGSCGAVHYFNNCRAMVKSIACARYIFINEGSTAFSCLPIRRETTVIQTWHGCGAFKRVGMSAYGNGDNVSGGNFERRVFPMCRHMDFITVSGEGVAWAYEEAFDLHEGDGQRICPVGTSRTDIYFDKETVARSAHRIRAAYPQSNGKKIILYAPTFRGETTAPVMPDRLDIELLRRRLEDGYILLIKHHPVIKQKQEIPDSCADFAFDASGHEAEELLMAADICISDYSSIVFDYSLLDRPMIFFVYDIEEYSDWRGLYYPIEDFCPGVMAETSGEVADAVLSENLYDAKKMRDFRALHMSACDGHATERIIALMDEIPDKCL